MANFESFSEDLIPRILPQPTLHPVLDMSKPTVPEVSLIFDDSKQLTVNNETQPKSYKVWKQQQQQQQCQEPIANVLPNKMLSSDRKKIVTFDLPTDYQTETKILPQIVENSPIAQCQQLDVSLYEPKNSSNGIGHSIPANFIPTEMPCNQQDYDGCVPYRNDNGMHMSVPLSNQMNCVGTPNQQIPKQHFTNQVTNNSNYATAREITLNEIYQLLQNMQVNKRPSLPNEAVTQQTYTVGGLDRYQQSNNLSNVPDRLDAPHSFNRGDPSTRDIFNVILKQQEQLMNLQSQVQLLLMRSATTAPILHQQQQQQQQHQQRQSESTTTNRIIHTNTNVNEIDTRKKQMSVMTSLEINVQNSKSNGIQTTANFNTPQNTKRVAVAAAAATAVKGNQSMKKCGCICNCDEQKTVQSSDSGSNDDNLDVSPDRGETQTGWTFYGNILNQVNDVLQSTPPPAAIAANVKANENNNTSNVPAHIDHNYSTPSAHSSHSMPKQIRTAQFKQVGFQIDDVNISAMSKRITFGSSSPDTPRTPAQRIISNDNSVLINALAMKYLPYEVNGTPSPNRIQNAAVQMTTPTNVRTTTAAEVQAQMTPVTPVNTTTTTTVNGFMVNRQNELDGNKNPNTDMSITSYRYMEKYGLL